MDRRGKVEIYIQRRLYYLSIFSSNKVHVLLMLIQKLLRRNNDSTLSKNWPEVRLENFEKKSGVMILRSNMSRKHSNTLLKRI